MKKPGFFLSLIPVILMTVLLAVAVSIFGDDVTGGPSQIAIITTCVVTCLIGVYGLKIPWETFDEAIGENMKKTGSAIFILLMIGALTSTWMLSGVVPTMIDYGLKLIHPKIFIFISFILCTLVSLLAGSSWTTVGTIGVAMLSAGQIIGLPTGWLAGAIISGAYLGDKISPLSDTTNLSASIAEVPLYTHVKYMMGTTMPAFIICSIVYLIVGFSVPVSSNIEVGAQLTAIESTFNISPWLLLIPCATFFMIYKKVPPFLTLFISAFIGALVAFWAQPQIITQAAEGLGGFGAFCFTTFKMMASGLSIDTGNELMSNLTSTSGMLGMLNTISLIICVIALSGALYASGMIQSITEKMLLLMKNTTSVVASTVFTCIFCNIILADQYMAILLPGRMFADTYKRKGLAPELLSRTLEDSATVSSVLVPWNTCAVAQSGVLGIATMVYFPYAIFCFITPVIAIAIAASGWKIRRIPVQEEAPQQA
jgi:Na+/H+ antiporter NhaC